jgi:GAF domain-containing protein
MARAARELAATLETDFSKVLALDDAASELRLREGVGWADGLVGTATVPTSEAGSQADYTLAAGEPVVVTDLATESRFDGPALLTEHGVRSGISTIVGPADSPWGVLGVHDRRPRHFSEHDVHFVQSVANILAAAIERHEIEATLRRQREQLAALNSLNETIHETTASIIEQSSREAIEATVCEHLAAADSYCFAWTADLDPAAGTVRLRTEAGVEGYLDGTTLLADPADDRECGPTARAIRTGEIQTVRDCQHDAEYEPWHGMAAAHGFRSSAAIPISHEGTVYGALNVYAARPNAFDGHERAVIGQLGEIVGHAIAAIQRKRALMNDEVVQLEFHADAPFDAVGVDAPTDGTVRLDHAVPVGDERFLVYGHATPDAVETVESLVAAVPHWESVRLREESGAFELRLREPPVLSALASLGGTAERAVIEDGSFRLTLAVSPGVDVRDVVETVQDAYPDAELRRQRQVSRRRAAPAADGDGPGPDFTDCQRTALEVAYRAGFFEWPRAASGEAVADALDVAPSTFHQHLRKAERKLVAALFADGAAPAVSARRRDE